MPRCCHDTDAGPKANTASKRRRIPIRRASTPPPESSRWRAAPHTINKPIKLIAVKHTADHRRAAKTPTHDHRRHDNAAGSPRQHDRRHHAGRRFCPGPGSALHVTAARKCRRRKTRCPSVALTTSAGPIARSMINSGGMIGLSARRSTRMNHTIAAIASTSRPASTASGRDQPVNHRQQSGPQATASASTPGKSRSVECGFS